MTTHVRGEEAMTTHVSFLFHSLKKNHMILILVTFIKGKNIMVKENNMKRTLERLSLLRKKNEVFIF